MTIFSISKPKENFSDKEFLGVTRTDTKLIKGHVTIFPPINSLVEFSFR